MALSGLHWQSTEAANPAVKAAYNRLIRFEMLPLRSNGLHTQSGLAPLVLTIRVMSKYKIEVRGLGYEDHVMIVEASTLREAKRHELEAKLAWCKHNNVDEDTVEMPFTRVSKINH